MPDIEKLRALNLFQGQILNSNNIHTEISQHFQEPFGPMVLTFCGPPLPNYKGNWPEGLPFFPHVPIWFKFVLVCVHMLDQ